MEAESDGRNAVPEMKGASWSGSRSRSPVREAANRRDVRRLRPQVASVRAVW